jgi:hypothetical protein
MTTHGWCEYEGEWSRDAYIGSSDGYKWCGKSRGEDNRDFLAVVSYADREEFSSVDIYLPQNDAGHAHLRFVSLEATLEGRYGRPSLVDNDHAVWNLPDEVVSLRTQGQFVVETHTVRP